MSAEIWEVEFDEADLWEVDPERAAQLVYMRLQCHWHNQVVRGEYEGIPVLHSQSSREGRRIEAFERDAVAGEFRVDPKVRRRFARLFSGESAVAEEHVG